ncbi:hypothetical protein [Paenibacillus sp. L3-i20]|uniref:hypothetical protein n=1 Tax=Paenibacillus sp. L3-i20 TaxID=2905833 RepID=UPI001EDF3698|nr:hypothetical protein [Paenibacillus sp. L3-i20]GKU78752.1 hypothetical protein L3i20_v231490 [Paenibacillus sp. L3-i20]
MSTVEFKQCFTLGTVDKMLLDAAHDAEAIYLLLDQAAIWKLQIQLFGYPITSGIDHLVGKQPSKKEW